MNADFTSHSETLNEAFHAWSSLYVQTHSMPEKRLSANLGWKFWAIAIVCVAQILLAALRTAEVFYDAALISSGNSVLAISEAFLAILAVEVGMVVYAAIDAVRKGKTDEIGGAFASILIMLGISMTAGLLQSISIVMNIDPVLLKWLQYGVSISTGVGASFIAFIGGKYLGVQVVLRDTEQFEIDQEHREEMENYQASMLRSWQSSKEYKVARSGLQMPIYAQQEIVATGEGSPVRERQNWRDPKSFLRNYGQSEVRDKIYEYLDPYKDSDELPTPTQIANDLGCSKSYASTCTSEWMVQNDYSWENDDEMFGENGR